MRFGNGGIIIIIVYILYMYILYHNHNHIYTCIYIISICPGSHQASPTSSDAEDEESSVETTVAWPLLTLKLSPQNIK